MTAPEATPRPWRYHALPTASKRDKGRNGYQILGNDPLCEIAVLGDLRADHRMLRGEDEANAALIVRAVNAHDALVAACEAHVNAADAEDVHGLARAYTMIVAALALARKGGGS